MSKSKKKLKIRNNSDASTTSNLDVNKPASIDKVPFKPKKPTPLNLYALSKMDALLSLGKSKTQAFNDCTQEYKKMEGKLKLPWILQALQKEPAYWVP